MAKSKAKSTSVKKSIKSNKKQKFSLKNLDFKKNWKKLSYLGLAGFLALSSVGYGVWRTVDPSEASAFGQVLILSANSNQSARLYMCSKFVPATNTYRLGMFIRNGTAIGANASFNTNVGTQGSVGAYPWLSSATKYYNLPWNTVETYVALSLNGRSSTSTTLRLAQLPICW